MENKDLKCRFCGKRIKDTFVDLGLSPLSNSYVAKGKENWGEMTYPLHVYVCSECFLVQLAEFESPENIFSDYAYFSSYSKSWLEHVEKYADFMIKKYGFDHKSLVIEIASNDGYLLQFFKKEGVSVLGIEPAKNVAEIAKKEKNIPTITEFFNTTLAEQLSTEGKKADLLLGNNVLAHVPNINDFVAGMKIALNPEGIITMEFPHLLNLMQKTQFDTIYHEHFSYLSFTTVQNIFAAHGLQIFDVQEWPTHGGSLRVFACHKECQKYAVDPSVENMLRKETVAGLADIRSYHDFADAVKKVKRDLLKLLIELKEQGKKIVAYGAAAKGNTLLNYCGIKSDFIEYVVDMNPHKQNTFLPGSRIPVYAPDKLIETKPEYILILPWNLKDEICDQLAYTKQWGAKFLVAIPTVEVII
ncbi:MAG: methyltransferase domain-containing protein [Selenomonadaceae bacterium]